jgi:hypothetical protein
MDFVSKLQLLQQIHHPKYGSEVGRVAVQTVFNGARLNLLETERTLRGEENLQDSLTICRYAQTLLPKDCNQNLQGKSIGSRRSDVLMGRGDGTRNKANTTKHPRDWREIIGCRQLKKSN